MTSSESSDGKDRGKSSDKLKRKRRAGGRPAYQRTDADEAIVRAMAIYGVSRQEIAFQLKIDPKTLTKNYDFTIRTARTALGGRAVANICKAMSSSNEYVSFNASKFYLERCGKNLGWSPKPDHPEPPDPFAGLDLSRLSTKQFDMLTEILTAAGAKFEALDQDDEALARKPPLLAPVKKGPDKID